MSDLSRETDDLLSAGRHADTLDPADKARFRRAIALQLAAGSTVVATTSSAAAWTVTAKVMIVVALVGSVAGGTALVLSSQAKGGRRAVSAPASMGVPSNMASRTAPLSGVAPQPTPPTPLAPMLPAVAPSTVPRTSGRTTALPTDPRPLTSATATRTSLEEETWLLREADDALKVGDPNRALRILGDLAARFPGSSLAPERSAERIFALCIAGRTEEARAAARTFLEGESTGPLAARVRASCGGPARE